MYYLMELYLLIHCAHYSYCVICHSHRKKLWDSNVAFLRQFDQKECFLVVLLGAVQDYRRAILSTALLIILNSTSWFIRPSKKVKVCAVRNFACRCNVLEKTIAPFLANCRWRLLTISFLSNCSFLFRQKFAKT